MRYLRLEAHPCRSALVPTRAPLLRGAMRRPGRQPRRHFTIRATTVVNPKGKNVRRHREGSRFLTPLPRRRAQPNVFQASG